MNDDENKLYKELEKHISTEIAKAYQDALINGTGLLSITADGNIKHVTMDEITQTVKFILGKKNGFDN